MGEPVFEEESGDKVESVEEDDLPDLNYVELEEYDSEDDYDDGYCMDEFREAEYMQEVWETRKEYEQERMNDEEERREDEQEWTQEEHLRKLAEEYPGDDEFTNKNLTNIVEVIEIEIGEDQVEVFSQNQASAYAYKKVANRTKPVATTLPEEFRIKRKIPVDPLLDFPELPSKAPPFTPGVRYTQDRKDAMKINQDGFLTQDEEDLVHWIILENELAFAWDDTEKGKFSNEYFEPIVFPTVEHVPWVLRNIPIARGSYDKVITAIRDKIKSGIYETSNSSYRSRLFAVLKKDGKSIRLVHDLQPLNQVSIKDSVVPPTIEPYAESFGARSIYTVFDLFVGFDQRELAVQSRDLTTFQTTLGTFRLTSIPMGYTNSMQIFHGDATFILQDEIPEVTIPFIDEIPTKGPPTRFELEDGTYETMSNDPNIQKIVNVHLKGVTRTTNELRKCIALIERPPAKPNIDREVDMLEMFKLHRASRKGCG